MGKSINEMAPFLASRLKCRCFVGGEFDDSLRIDAALLPMQCTQEHICCLLPKPAHVFPKSHARLLRIEV